MREILFRGQCEATNEWVYGLPVTETTLSNSISHISQYSGTERKFGRTNVKIKPESIGQSTGLLDKSGNEIFEGDILKSDMFDSQEFTCEFISGSFNGYTYGYLLKNEHFNRSEIIGNIHEEN